MSMVTMMSNVAIVTSLPLLAETFKDVENIEFLSRLMVTLPSLSIAILSPFLGHLIHKFGKKTSALIALFFFSILGSAGLYLDGVYAILISRFFFGISISILMIVSTSLVGDYFKNEARHKFMGIQSAFVAFGGVLFLIGGGFLSDMNWRYPFGIYLVGFLIMIFVYKYLVERNTKEVVQEEIINQNIFPVYFLAFILMVVFYSLPTQIPFLLANVFDASGTLTGEIIAIAFIFNALGAMSFSKLKKYFDFKTIYMIGMSIVAIGFILLGLITKVEFFFLTSPIIGFGGGVLMTSITAWMLSLSHHTKRVKSSSYLTSALFLGQFASPIIFHPLVSILGVKDFFITLGIALLAILILIFTYNTFKRKLYL